MQFEEWDSQQLEILGHLQPLNWCQQQVGIAGSNLDLTYGTGKGICGYIDNLNLKQTQSTLKDCHVILVCNKRTEIEHLCNRGKMLHLASSTVHCSHTAK